MKAALRTYTPPYEYYLRVGISREFRGGLFPDRERRPGVLGDPRERQLRRGVALLGQKQTRKQGEELIISVATHEARELMRAFRLEGEDADVRILEQWLKGGRGLANLLAGAQELGPVQSRNVLLARLKTFLRSRAVDVWRALYAEANPVAQFFWVRMGKVLKTPTRLVEARGVVGLKFRPHDGPGDPDAVPTHLLRPPTAPVMREHRLRLPRGANVAYERWMVECIKEAGGKLRRRTMAELLARVHGHVVRYPGQRRDDGGADGDAVSELEQAAAWVNAEKEDE